MDYLAKDINSNLHFVATNKCYFRLMCEQYPMARLN